MTYYTYNNPQSGDARWSKPAHPAANKTAFDCYGRTTPRNAASSPSGNAQHVHAEFFHGSSSDRPSAGSPFSGAQKATPAAQTAAVKILAGGALALIGLPLLILPGPGLLTIGAGIGIAASGIKDLQGFIAR